MFEFIIKNKIKQHKEQDREKIFKNLENIKSIIVLFETNKYEYADAYVKKFQKMGKKVSGFGYRVNNDKLDYSKTPYYVIDKKTDIDWKGLPTNKFYSLLDDIDCDAMIDLSINEHLFLEFMVAYVKAPLKIGLKKNELQLYDLAIAKSSENIPEEVFPVNELGEPIIFYLDSIQSTNKKQ
ncbi:hypothetical protein AwDysgo_14370 [Bacteroidales bacterium]|nr:hypothetical protein AwDysgo_14370 [Bacteroidales bacterium]